ncbi:MAG: DUF4465 domain-containing protein [Bacteroidota bacterium]
MRTFALLFSAVVLSTNAMNAQTIATFESLSLATADTFYVNYSSYGNDVGLNNGLAHLPCVYDTSGGFPYWSSGFAYSNKTDSVTSGYTNNYSAKTASGYNYSAKYAVASNFMPINIVLTGSAKGNPVQGFYITNATYAYNSMRDGDFVAKKFGGVTGNDPDWFKVQIRGYHGGVLSTTDSVDFYLADFRFANNAQDYIVKTWEWVNLLSLGDVDSLQLRLSSSDTAGGFGMNTPSYYCIDNFTTYETSLVATVSTTPVAKVYPIPATKQLNVEIMGDDVTNICVSDLTGCILAVYHVTEKVTTISTEVLAPGIYLLQLSGRGQKGSIRFVKQ